MESQTAEGFVMDSRIKEAISIIKGIAKDSGIIVEDGNIYTKVQDRIEAFRRVYGDSLGIRTIVMTPPPYKRGDIFIMRCEITKPVGETDTIVATGHAMEIIASDSFTSTAFIEVAETSAIGRALAAFGLHGGEYASAEEIQNVPNKQKALAETEAERDAVMSKDFDSLETDITQKKMTLEGLDEPLSKKDADFIRDTIISVGSLAKNKGELTAFWINNEKAFALLEKSDQDGYQQVIDFLNKTQGELSD
jgi:hypothetical protein